MLIEFKKVNFTYMPGTVFEKQALSDIDLTIDSGEVAGIIGHTGSGKSTLVQHMNGILKPSTGKVFVCGTDMTGKKLSDQRKKVGLVFQYPEYQLFEETVEKDVAFGLIQQGFRFEDTLDKVHSVLELVGIDRSDFKKSPFELSGGQKRRAAIAGVLVTDPEIIIHDEAGANEEPRITFNQKYTYHK